MRFKEALFVFGLLIVVAGCKKSSPLVGTWTMSKGVRSVQATKETTFNADGTYRTVLSASRDDHAVSVTSTDTGTWTYDGGKLKETATDVKWEFSGTYQAGIASERAWFDANKGKLLAAANKVPAETLRWDGDDKFWLTELGTTYVYNRKK